MRLADHQPQWAELEAAGGISAKPAIRRRAGAARRSAGAAGAALLRRQQGAVVRDHRRPAAISGLSAGLVPAARRRFTPAQPLRCSIRQAGPRGRSGRAIPISYGSHAIDAGYSFQCLIGEITAHEEFVNFVEIGDTIFHGNLQKIPSPLVWYIREGFGAVPCVTLRDIPILVGANRTRRSTLCRAGAVLATERHRRMGCGAGKSGAGRIVQAPTNGAL